LVQVNRPGADGTSTALQNLRRGFRIPHCLQICEYVFVRLLPVELGRVAPNARRSRCPSERGKFVDGDGFLPV